MALMITPLTEFLRRLYRKIPLGLRQHTTPVLYYLFYLIRRPVNALYPPVFVFEGKTQEGDLPFSFAYAGAHTLTQEYWATTALAPGFQKHSLGRCFFWHSLSLLKENHFDCDFVSIEHMFFTLKFLARTKGFRIPPWVRMEIILPNLDKKEWQDKKADIERLIRKNHLEYEIVHDPAAFDDFYYKMHLPYIKDRYEETAVFENPQGLKEAFSRGGLILVKKGKDILGGGLFEYLPKQVRLRKFGIRDGNWEYVRLGVIGAMYYFLMVEMEKKGYEKILIGGTRPLLNDGVTKYKISVNAKLITKIDGTCLWLKFLKDSPALKNFLVNNPFVHFPKPNKPRRAIFLDLKPGSAQEEIDKILHASACEGLTGTDLFIFGDIKDLPDTTKSPAITIAPAKKLFKGTF
jgi:hypothetical protein